MPSTAATAACAPPRSTVYHRRQPERTLLYRTVQTHLATWLELEDDGCGHHAPAGVEREFRRYLDCGILAHGFARAHYHFFGAPAGLLFFVDRALAQGAWVDMGMFIENVMLAARAHGLATCPQASLAEYPDIVRGILTIPATRALVCGMALGYADASAPVNSYRTEREPLSAFASWYE